MVLLLFPDQPQHPPHNVPHCELPWLSGLHSAAHISHFLAQGGWVEGVGLAGSGLRDDAAEKIGGSGGTGARRADLLTSQESEGLEIFSWWGLMPG